MVLSFICFGEIWGQFRNPYRRSRPTTGDYVVGALSSLSQKISQEKKYGRNSLRKAINNWGKCKTGTLSLEYGAAAIYGNNGYLATATVNDELSEMLNSFHSRSMSIDDINILENGNYIVVYDNGRGIWGRFPNYIENAIRQIDDDGKVLSATLSEDNYFFIVTEDTLYTNSPVAAKFYREQKKTMGQLYSVSTSGTGTSQGIIFCFANGTSFFGYIPKEVKNAMDNFSGTAYFVKYNVRGDYLICSKSEYYHYHIVDVDQSSLAEMTYKSPPSILPPTTPSNITVVPTVPISPQGTYTDNGSGGQTTISSHQCRVCGGSGSTVSETWLGNTSSTKYCEICRKQVYVSHHHVPCSTCGGNGIVSY